MSKLIIYPTRNSTTNLYETLNIKDNFPIPEGWLEYPNLTSDEEDSNTLMLPSDSYNKKDVNTYKYNTDTSTWIDDIDYIKKIQKKAISAIRWERERSGFTFNSVPINTDDVSQNKINGAVSSVLVDPTYTLNWRCDDGTFITLDADSIKALGTAVRNHIQYQFDKEMYYVNIIDTLTTREAIFDTIWDDDLDISNNNA